MQNFVFSIGGLLAVVLVGLACHRLRPSANWPLRLVFAASCIYLLLSMRVVADVLTMPLLASQPFDAASWQEPNATIVLLGGSSSRVPGYQRTVWDLDPVTLSRALEAARVYHALPGSRVISSGGVSPADVGQPVAAVMRDSLLAFGVPASDIDLETDSRTTRHEAEILAPRLIARGARRFVLVTSASHMPRALATFRAFGLEPAPAPAPNPNVLPPPWRWIPTANGLAHSEAMAHEYLGMLYYALRGWISLDDVGG